ncbi:peptidyl-prolyl cis-trans isomerase [Paucibacter sp. KBW04]|uniref:peptidylprolyl isomerase n=1 Tax=Paucibacter sp. KBW04 TaxID=2153361 RepID=UPI000F56F7F3|nr:peptidylprolyl isomerase [Paucibacter sp. KBW04]RQO54743.1 peptidyl-prolyl cis-trans isomerase [Paucibacter sp. KBW04]
MPTLSKPLPSTGQPSTQPAPLDARSQRGAWLREPLLHFLLLGGFLFGIDHLLVGRADDPHRISVGAEVTKEATELFQASRGRPPTTEELKALRQVWLDNEVLYREGLALQVDRGDSAIRERVIFKALSVVDANTKLPPADEKTLRDWFEAHRSKYDEPPRFDFQEAALSGREATEEATVRAFVAELNAGTPGDAKAGLRIFKNRPLSNLEQSYGPELAPALQAATPGEWRALKTSSGWRAMRLDALIAPKPADFATLRNIVQQDWTDAVLAEQRTAAVRALAKKYKVVDESAQP